MPGVARLFLEVNRVLYAVTPLPVEPTVEFRAWRLRKTKGRTYDLHLDKN